MYSNMQRDGQTAHRECPFHLPPSRSYIYKGKGSPWEEIKLRRKKKKNAHQGNKVRPFESAREVGDHPNFRQRFGMVSWDDGEGWLGRRTYKSPGCGELGMIVCCLFLSFNRLWPNSGLFGQKLQRSTGDCFNQASRLVAPSIPLETLYYSAFANERATWSV